MIQNELLKAIEQEDLDRILDLLRAGADIEHVEPSSGMSPLVFAARYQPQLVLQLLDRGADVNARTPGGPSALYALLVEHEEECVDLAMMLVERGADYSARCMVTETAPIHHAAAWQDPRLLQLMADRGADLGLLDCGSRTPLHWAAQAGAVQNCDLLIAAGVDLEIQSHRRRTALIEAIETQNLEVVQALLTAGARPDGCFGGGTPLYYHISYWSDVSAEIFGELLSRGADVNAQSECGTTPLHLAAQEHNIDAVKMLLEAGANPSMTDHYGQTPLHFTREVDVAEALLKGGARIDEVDHDGDTLLDRMWNLYPELTKFLVMRGARPTRTKEEEAPEETEAISTQVSCFSLTHPPFVPPISISDLCFESGAYRVCQCSAEHRKRRDWPSSAYETRLWQMADGELGYDYIGTLDNGLEVVLLKDTIGSMTTHHLLVLSVSSEPDVVIDESRICRGGIRQVFARKFHASLGTHWKGSVSIAGNTLVVQSTEGSVDRYEVKL